ncbi:MAG TPA: 30S ribosomal protein S20, partial [Candidatus Limnocylindrales bacterium]
MARTPRKWQGARTPSGLKRVRQAERRHAILQPRRSAAKTLVAKAVTVAETQPEGADVGATLAEAISALDRAAKSGAIHPNAAARRKSRLTRKVNASVGGTTVASAHVAKSTSKAAATKAAKARIAAGKASKAKGAQTAAGKARAALSRTTRSETAPAPA